MYIPGILFCKTLRRKVKYKCEISADNWARDGRKMRTVYKYTEVI